MRLGINVIRCSQRCHCGIVGIDWLQQQQGTVRVRTIPMAISVLLRLGYVQNQVLTSPHTGNPSFAVFVLTYFFFSWLETDLATYLCGNPLLLGHRSYLLTCRRSVAGGARVLTYCSKSWYSRLPNWRLLLTSLSSIWPD